MPDLQSRYQEFLKRLRRGRLDGFVVSRPLHLFYLFGFRGSSGLGLTLEGETFLLVDSRYLEQSQAETRNCRIEPARHSLESTLRRLLKKAVKPARSPFRIGLESRHVSWDFLRRLESWGLAAEWVPLSDVVEKLRTVKGPEEIEILRDAFRRAQRAYRRIRKEIRPGRTERQVAAALEHQMRLAGGDGTAFDTLVASGPRSSLPHGTATDRILQEKEWVVVDFGIRFDGYASDLTRIEFLPRARPPEILQVVREARLAALEQIRHGAGTAQVDSAARRLIERAGFGEFFGHGTGHGLGLEVHEAPSVSRRRSTPLKAGMVLTVEPGIYLPGRFGVRLEDVVVVTPQGYEFLSDPDA